MDQGVQRSRMVREGAVTRPCQKRRDGTLAGSFEVGRHRVGGGPEKGWKNRQKGKKKKTTSGMTG